jgi:hypothetical protein
MVAAATVALLDQASQLRSPFSVCCATEALPSFLSMECGMLQIWHHTFDDASDLAAVFSAS